MVQRVLIPLILISFFLFIARSVDVVKGYDFPVWTFCRISPQGPAADILFVGSSRIRASFNAAFMEERARALTGNLLSVDMISSSSTDLILFNALSRKYLDEKGPPEHVFIEAMHTTRKNIDFFAAHQGRSMSPYVSNVGSAFLPIGRYGEILSEPPFDNILTRLNPQHTNVVELAATQYVSAFYRFLQAPSESLTDRRQKCMELEPDEASRKSEFEKMNDEWRRNSPILVDDALRETHTFAGTEKNVAPRAPMDPARTYENAALQALVKVYKDAGVKNIYIVVLASFEEPKIGREVREAYHKLFPGTSVIFTADLYQDHPDLSLMYIDRFHYNASGTNLLSRFYLDRVLQADD